MIELRGVSKSYGEVRALDGLDLTIPDGSMYGFVGPNGAGKTTTFRILLGLLYADEGSVKIDDMDASSQVRRLRKRIGYVPDYTGLYSNMRVREYMEFFASCYELSGSRVRRRIQMLLDLIDLGGKERMMVDALSRGMQQMLSLARALIHDPRILILDEPMLGMDPGTRYGFKKILSELAGEGGTILISSHILAEISELCTDVGIIDHGHMVLEGRLSEVLKKVNASNPVVISVEGSLSSAMYALKRDTRVRSISIRERKILITYDGELGDEAELLRKLIESGVPVSSFHRELGNLESLFMQLTGSEQGQERVITDHEATDYEA